MRKISECYRKLEWNEIAKKGIVRKGGYFVEFLISDKSWLKIENEYIEFSTSKDDLYCGKGSYERIKGK